MTTFPMSQDNYSVEEISYDDMMSILANQKQGKSNNIESSATDQSLSQRIAENANKQLPSWLANH